MVKFLDIGSQEYEDGKHSSVEDVKKRLAAKFDKQQANLDAIVAVASAAYDREAHACATHEQAWHVALSESLAYAPSTVPTPMSEQVNLLRTYNKWRRSEIEGSMDDLGLHPAAIGKAIDAVLGDYAALSAHNKQEGE